MKTNTIKIAYLTANIPWGKGENFLIEEIISIKDEGAEIIIIPRTPPKEIFHKEANEFLPNALWFPLLNIRIVYYFIISLFTKQKLWKNLFLILWKSRSLRILVKNLLVAPKGVFIANLLEMEGVEHIHAHWGTTTATMAWVISELTNIPWSFTLHRWDIEENNMLKEKLESAEFIRCISELGQNELLNKFGNGFKNKIEVIHMGVNIPKNNYVKKYDEGKIVIITPADLLPVKGHSYLIEACSILVKSGLNNIQCFFYGEGIMKKKLEEMIKKEELDDYIKMPGMIPHEDLLAIYEKEQVDIVILPSIITNDKQHEGIPVTLMEAMAYSIPVISTNTGGIPELLSKNAGIMVEEKNPKQLAAAVRQLIENPAKREKISRRGYERVCKEFNIKTNAKKLLDMIKFYS